MQWNVLDTGVQTPEENMQFDSKLLESLDAKDHPVLHLYDWKGDSATYGYFIKPEKYLKLTEAKRKGLQLARRPTGGGIIFHIWDLAFSVLVPAHHPYFSQNTLENYAFVNHLVVSAVSEFLSDKPEIIPCDAQALDSNCLYFCMARPTKYDVVLQGKKIAGSSQRKTKKGFLHQGTIALKMPSEEYLREILQEDTKVLEAMKTHTFPLLEKETNLQEGRLALKMILKKHITRNV